MIDEMKVETLVLDVEEDRTLEYVEISFRKSGENMNFVIKFELDHHSFSAKTKIFVQADGNFEEVGFWELRLPYGKMSTLSLNGEQEMVIPTECSKEYLVTTIAHFL